MFHALDPHRPHPGDQGGVHDGICSLSPGPVQRQCALRTHEVQEAVPVR
uniref:Uncharacterized protein n=1 Tax=Anguilla anguilla TaxID=7936 RepID=A0A0E9T7S3_ANGAN